MESSSAQFCADRPSPPPSHVISRTLIMNKFTSAHQPFHAGCFDLHFDLHVPVGWLFSRLTYIYQTKRRFWQKPEMDVFWKIKKEPFWCTKRRRFWQIRNGCFLENKKGAFLVHQAAPFLANQKWMDVFWKIKKEPLNIPSQCNNNGAACRH